MVGILDGSIDGPVKFQEDFVIFVGEKRFLEQIEFARKRPNFVRERVQQRVPLRLEGVARGVGHIYRSRLAGEGKIITPALGMFHISENRNLNIFTAIASGVS
jgi:hypothetical protein